MQKLSIQQQLSQKLSPQQIQFIKLLQIPAAELESRIEEELEINPALEEDDNADIEEDFTNEDSSVNEVDTETDAENFGGLFLDSTAREVRVGRIDAPQLKLQRLIFRAPLSPTFSPRRFFRRCRTCR